LRLFMAVTPISFTHVFHTEILPDSPSAFLRTSEQATNGVMETGAPHGFGHRDLRSLMESTNPVRANPDNPCRWRVIQASSSLTRKRSSFPGL
jgi:hypothetical protein